MAKLPSIPAYGTAGDVEENTAYLGRRQITNYTGHSYLSRFLVFGIGGWIYKKQKHIVERLMEELAGSLKSLFETGLVGANGQTYFAALVGIKGDMDFHSKYWQLLRSYSNIGTTNDLMFCHRCFAGSSEYPGEDYGEQPGWLNTLDSSRPWDVNNPPPLAAIPFDRTAPERALQGDLFHLFKVGVGRDIVGGVIVTLMRKGFFDYENSSKNLPDRFVRAHSVFSLWCRSEGFSPGLRSFSKSFFNIKTMMSAPWVSSKGSDTMLLLRFCCFFLNLNIINPHVDGYKDMLRDMLEVCQSAVNLTMVHSHGAWLERDCARKLYVDLMIVLRGYAALGEQVINMQIRAFIIKPKHHGLHHLAVGLKTALEEGAVLIPSPQIYACETNEDFIGRISRLSRRVGFRLCDLRVCQRVFLKTHALFKARSKPVTVKGHVTKRARRR